MEFTITPEESQSIARDIAKFYEQNGYKIFIEKAIGNDAPYRTTLIAQTKYSIILIEVQNKLAYHTVLKELASWIARERLNCELFICLSSDSSVPITKIKELKSDGVGLLTLENESVEVHLKAKNFGLVVNPNPILNYGKFKNGVLSSLKKFNDGERKDGLRDLCEIFEDAMDELGTKIAVKKWFRTITAEEFTTKKLSEQIDLLASKNAYVEGKTCFIDETLKVDLHSFRGARNLVDHKVRTVAQELKRQKQYHERMVMGPRLISDIEAIRRKIR